MQPVHILSAARTPVGTINGALSSVPAHKLGTVAITKALQMANVKPEQVDEVIMGQVLTANQGQNPVRQASINAGIPIESPAFGVSMVCGSGLKSVGLAFNSIRTGDSNIVVCGGQESMSQAPHCLNARPGTKFGHVNMEDCMLKDGLTDAFTNIHMGITAENIAKKYGLTKEEQDKFAVSSQNKCEEAQKNGYFKNEIVPVEIPSRKGAILVDKDEFPRAGATLESVAKVKPAFIRDASGTVSAANASGINDGAAALVLASEETLKKDNLKSMAKIVSFAQAGVDPQYMGLGPIPSVRKALEKAGWTVEDVDLFELNEAFAAQSLAVVKDLGVPLEKCNVNGGAIAIGHPIGASGARILTTLLHEMERRDAKKGVASLCIGGGMGCAICVERA
eukprot:GCRY01001345.1.p1 GENE.GCRY01001345.1~~GCRY01001345.1.p1  ORF type:complete len:394 (+),score=90.73 GCRY01001345.1:79-1260(+)